MSNKFRFIVTNNITNIKVGGYPSRIAVVNAFEVEGMTRRKLSNALPSKLDEVLECTLLDGTVVTISVEDKTNLYGYFTYDLDDKTIDKFLVTLELAEFIGCKEYRVREKLSRDDVTIINGFAVGVADENYEPVGLDTFLDTLKPFLIIEKDGDLPFTVVDSIYPDIALAKFQLKEDAEHYRTFKLDALTG
jgi:hypothetical protein